VIELNDMIGKHYDAGRVGPCQRLVADVFERFGIPFPMADIAGQTAGQVTDTLDAEIEKHTAALGDWEEIPEPVAPCLVVLRAHPRFANHLGVYVGEGKFIHAKGRWDQGGIVCAERISHPVYRNNIAGFYRYKGKAAY